MWDGVDNQMKKPIKIALLAVAGTSLLVVSHVTTSYDRSDMATLEQLLGFLLLLLAGGLCLVKMGDPVELKPAKAAVAAEAPQQAQPAEPAPAPDKK